MEIPEQSKLIIGWDVRGWMSNEQAVAILKVLGDSVEWLGFSERFKLPYSESLSFFSFLSSAFDDGLVAKLLRYKETVIAIDAPLAFSSEFRDLVNGEARSIKPPKAEIENPLAYRACERWIKDQFNKKPLSASFDKLGNNASLAISFARSLKSEGFQLVPQDGVPCGRTIIEVYPGLTKVGFNRNHDAIPPFAQYIPPQFRPGTDVYDAAICALLGAVFSGWRDRGIPELKSPVDGMDESEGWIFCLPPDYVRNFQARSGN